MKCTPYLRLAGLFKFLGGPDPARGPQFAHPCSRGKDISGHFVITEFDIEGVYCIFNPRIHETNVNTVEFAY